MDATLCDTMFTCPQRITDDTFNRTPRKKFLEWPAAWRGIMNLMFWGLLGPERITSTRRTRTLDLGAVVRFFNERAVPGMGGITFAKQLFLATLGVSVANKVRSAGYRVQNIETANAIEAIACRGAYIENGWLPDRRCRGNRKMRARQEFSFEFVRKPNFYVTQPMRMASVQPLLALGLVEARSQRFNTYRCTELGDELIAVATENYNPCFFTKTVLEYLTEWVAVPSKRLSNSDKLRLALSPIESMSLEAREFVRELLIRDPGDNGKRRRDALTWVEGIPDDAVITWEQKPAAIKESDHWRDLRIGARFFQTLNAALDVLEKLEQIIAVPVQHP